MVGRAGDLPYGHDGAVEVRFVQPYEAHKEYQCPGCNREIAPGTGHVVVIPLEATDFRRHWHRGCWAQAERTIPT